MALYSYLPRGLLLHYQAEHTQGANKVRVGIKLFKQLHLQLWTEKMIVKVEQYLSLEISGHSLDTDRQHMTGRQEGRRSDQD